MENWQFAEERFNTMQKIWIAVLTAGLMGCATSNQPESEPVVEGVHTQKNARAEVQSVMFAPVRLDCANTLHCPTLGLQWNASKPQQAVLTVGFAYGTHPPVESVEFLARPNGPMRVRTLAPEQPNQPGEVAFQMPLDTLERVVISRGVLVRVTAGGVVYEETLASGEHFSPAFNALKRWMQQIYQGQDKEQSLGLRGLFGQPYVHER